MSYQGKVKAKFEVLKTIPCEMELKNKTMNRERGRYELELRGKSGTEKVVGIKTYNDFWSTWEAGTKKQINLLDTNYGWYAEPPKEEQGKFKGYSKGGNVNQTLTKLNDFQRQLDKIEELCVLILACIDEKAPKVYEAMHEDDLPPPPRDEDEPLPEEDKLPF